MYVSNLKDCIQSCPFTIFVPFSITNTLFLCLWSRFHNDFCPTDNLLCNSSGLDIVDLFICFSHWVLSSNKILYVFLLIVVIVDSVSKIEQKGFLFKTSYIQMLSVSRSPFRNEIFVFLLSLFHHLNRALVSLGPRLFALVFYSILYNSVSQTLQYFRS